MAFASAGIFVLRYPDHPPALVQVHCGSEIRRLWASDFGANAVVSFRPETETFTTYPGSAPRASVRRILGRPGEVWLPESGTNRLMVIRYGMHEAN